MLSLLQPDIMDRFDEVEKVIAGMPPAEMPVTHRFTPGLYIREIFLRKGTIVTTKVHKTEHPYVISMGLVTVRSSDGVERFQAPWTGITKPGTKRIIYVEEDTIWTTFHVTNKTNILEIEADIIEPRVNKLLTAEESLRLVDASK